jgi:hypothetical protein
MDAVQPIEQAAIPLVKEIVKKVEECERQAVEDLRLTFAVYWEEPGLATKKGRVRLLPSLERLAKQLEDDALP